MVGSIGQRYTHAL
ncbi:hypothetical protein MJO28_015550 [Puccinia striiformis f. sp. tritici]|uniref:Uncharacterized protein n=1 Tax=Puccinia striiformis f. sp. tritici TaxID=168172 RepID=A0ACC0DQZ3_9BASI|nr:hypothetical protein MJO29_015815 [Puccinia striiformis f. sp. tritici]KAI7936651.1 hypothetical protein MJO28_015550 [Puccinia striiformis f. sp. tritici]